MAYSAFNMLCRYRYDAQDRLAASTPNAQADVLRFYQKNRLATEIQGALHRSVFAHEDLPLAQQQRRDCTSDAILLATDPQGSVLQLMEKTATEALAYTAYGHHPADSGLASLLGFNGEPRDPVTGHYLLGNGYRAFNPVLMRFNSPDSLSPFGEGGLNAYAYCQGDPVNSADPTGHAPLWKVLRSRPRPVMLEEVSAASHAIGRAPAPARASSSAGSAQTAGSISSSPAAASSSGSGMAGLSSAPPGTAGAASTSQGAAGTRRPVALVRPSQFLERSYREYRRALVAAGYPNGLPRVFERPMNAPMIKKVYQALHYLARAKRISMEAYRDTARFNQEAYDEIGRSLQKVENILRVMRDVP
ncbi:RHS repeat-associated core domain-containing protein [Pseudomonas floridensis]|uniref:RHS repeat-associated core domain-containing protein n=1 Tax=Pseudomonas floridensis TaxID=1958950 RepID=UPI0039E94A86